MRVFQEESGILWQVNNVCAVARKIFVSPPQAFSKPIKRWKRQKDERRALPALSHGAEMEIKSRRVFCCCCGDGSFRSSRLLFCVIYERILDKC
jgi:hypothetical protein